MNFAKQNEQLIHRLEDNQTAEVRRLSTLLEISQVLLDTLHLSDSLKKVISILVDHPSVEDVMISLSNGGIDPITLTHNSSRIPSSIFQAAASRGIAHRVIENLRPVIDYSQEDNAK